MCTKQQVSRVEFMLRVTRRKLHFSCVSMLTICVFVYAKSCSMFRCQQPFLPSLISPVSDLMKVNEAAVNVNQKHSIQKAKSHNQLTLTHEAHNLATDGEIERCVSFLSGQLFVAFTKKQIFIFVVSSLIGIHCQNFHVVFLCFLYRSFHINTHSPTFLCDFFFCC